MKIYVDTTIMRTISIDVLNNIIAADNKLCFTNTIVDMFTIQRHSDWLEEQIKKGKVFIECWSSKEKSTPMDSLDEMVSKKFYWSSLDLETNPAISFVAVLDVLSDLVLKETVDDIKRLTHIVAHYGLSKGFWPMGKWSKPIPISDEDAKALGVYPLTDNRSAIFAAAKKTKNWDAYSHYNVGYCTGLARQHCCNGILNANGTISVLPRE